jgi:hypothetical protein
MTWTAYKTPHPTFFYCSVCIRCLGNVFNELVPSNGLLFGPLFRLQALRGEHTDSKVISYAFYLFQANESRLKMDLSELGCCGMDWIHLAQDRDQWRALVNMIMKLRVP